VGAWPENQENASEGGDQMTLEEEIPVKNRNQVSPMWEPQHARLKILQPIAYEGHHKSLNWSQKEVVFCDSNWVVQTQTKTGFISFHTCAVLQSNEEMTQFHLAVMMTNH
jgi:glucan biosynthesis protein